MLASKPATPLFFDNGYGETDFAKVDAHGITAEEYEEIPELTDEMMARAVEHIGGVPVRQGRPKSGSPKRQVTLRLDADLLDAMRASGPGWQGRANAALRERFKP